MAKQRKIKVPSQSGLQLKIEKITYMSGVKLNLENFHPKAQYSNAWGEFKANAIVPEGMTKEEAKEQLKEYVHDVLDEIAQERVEHWMEVLGLQK